MNKIAAYEVIRIIDGKPLFAHDHYDRLINTLIHSNINVTIEKSIFFKNIHKLIVDNNLVSGNIKIEVIFDTDTKNIDFQSYIVPHSYPTEYQYSNGVGIVLFQHVRTNPQQKIWNQQLRDTVDAEIKKKSVFELLYYDDKNIISECTRANFFLINSNILYSPLSSKILLGITRKYILSAAQQSGMQVVERDMFISELSSFDAAFISGTSPKILPISNIDNIIYNVDNRCLRKLMNSFNKIIDCDIANFQW